MHLHFFIYFLWVHCAQSIDSLGIINNKQSSELFY